MATNAHSNVERLTIASEEAREPAVDSLMTLDANDPSTQDHDQHSFANKEFTADAESTTQVNDDPFKPDGNNSEVEEDRREQFRVDWEGPDDSLNPRNWSTGYKSWITFQLGMLALAASLGSSIISPAGSAIARYVGVSDEVAVLSISLYM